MNAVFLAFLSLPAADVDFARDVRPILGKCVRCHGAKRAEGGLRLDLRTRARQGGDSGLALGKSGTLLERVTHADDEKRMPPAGRLRDTEVAALRAWIEKDAPWPDEFAGKDAAADHWAFRPLVRPAVPVVRDAAWV